MARAYWEIFKTLRGGEWLAADESWLKMPLGHRALSKVRQANDIVLRYLHRPLELIDLDLQADPAGDDVLARVREVPPGEWSPDQPDLRTLPVWLRMQASESRTDVLVGSRWIGTTHMPTEAWRSLSGEAERQVFADGSLVVRAELSRIPLLTSCACSATSPEPAGDPATSRHLVWARIGSAICGM